LRKADTFRTLPFAQLLMLRAGSTTEPVFASEMLTTCAVADTHAVTRTAAPVVALEISTIAVALSRNNVDVHDSPNEGAYILIPPIRRPTGIEQFAFGQPGNPGAASRPVSGGIDELLP